MEVNFLDSCLEIGTILFLTFHESTYLFFVTVNFGLSEKHTKFEKKSSLCFRCLLRKYCVNFCVLLKKSQLYMYFK